jgi:hypothetical protein
MARRKQGRLGGNPGGAGNVVPRLGTTRNIGTTTIRIDSTNLYYLSSSRTLVLIPNWAARRTRAAAKSAATYKVNTIVGNPQNQSPHGLVPVARIYQLLPQERLQNDVLEREEATGGVFRDQIRS